MHNGTRRHEAGVDKLGTGTFGTDVLDIEEVTGETLTTSEES